MKTITVVSTAFLLAALPMASYSRTIEVKTWKLDSQGQATPITAVLTNSRTVAGDTLVAKQNFQRHKGSVEIRGDSTYFAPGTVLLTNCTVKIYDRALFGDSTGADTRPVRIIASGLRDIESVEGGTIDRNAGIQIFGRLEAHRLEVEGFNNPPNGEFSNENGGHAIIVAAGGWLDLYDSATTGNVGGILVPWNQPLTGVSTRVRTFRCSFNDIKVSLDATIYSGTTFDDEFSHFARGCRVDEMQNARYEGVTVSRAFFLGSEIDSTAYGPTDLSGQELIQARPSVDFDGDGWVGFRDILIFVDNQEQLIAERPDLEPLDLNHDGKVDIGDVSLPINISNTGANCLTDQWGKQTKTGVAPANPVTPQEVEQLRAIFDRDHLNPDFWFTFLPQEVVDLLLQPTAVLEGDAALPQQFALEQNYPNPFNSSTVIRYQVVLPGKVRLDIVGLNGQILKSWSHDTPGLNKYEVVWDGRDEQGRGVSSGVYLVRLQMGEARAVRKIMLMK